MSNLEKSAKELVRKVLSNPKEHCLQERLFVVLLCMCCPGVWEEMKGGAE